MLYKRVVSALIALGVVLGTLFLAPSALTQIALVALIAFAGWEWGGLIAPGKRGVITVYAAVVALAYALVWYGGAAVPELRPALVLASLGVWLLALITITRYPIEFPAASVALAGLVILVPAFVALATVYTAEQGNLKLLLLLGIIWAADVGAYFVGRRFGSVKLAPAVSPGKSWEGVGGGVVAAVLVGVGGAWLLDLPMAPMAGLAVAVALLSVVGDLTVSMFKRNAGVKDSGKLFPGHGGLLDRVDSICAGAPLFATMLAVIAG